MISNQITQLNQRFEEQRQARELAEQQRQLEQKQIELSQAQVVADAARLALQTQIKSSLDRYAEKLRVLDETLKRGATGRSASAGGLCDDSAKGDGRASGHPWATGDMKLACRAQNVPEGWLPCIGGYVQRVSYPELYSVIGERFGSSSQDNFKLPGAADLPTVPSANVWWLIRL